MHQVLVIAIVALAAADLQKASDYLKLAGQPTTVCGRIVSYSMPDSGGCDTRLDIGAPYWKALFYVSVADAARTSFPEPPEEMYLNQEICVTGPVAVDTKRVAHIVVTKPEQIAIKETGVRINRFPPGAFHSCEKAISPLKLVHEVRPDYPSGELVLKRIEDLLLLDAIVAADGSVAAVRTVYMEHPEFERAAHESVKQWRFTPPTRGGRPVSTIVQIEMEFTLKKRPSRHPR
jgi:TonB family protein